MSVIARAHTGFVPSLRRIYALVLRHTYLLRSSGPRILELVYWPTVQMILWGFITMFLINHSSWIAQASGVLLSAVLLWDVLFRSQLGVSLTPAVVAELSCGTRVAASNAAAVFARCATKSR